MSPLSPQAAKSMVIAAIPFCASMFPRVKKWSLSPSFLPVKPWHINTIGTLSAPSGKYTIAGIFSPLLVEAILTSTLVVGYVAFNVSDIIPLFTALTIASNTSTVTYSKSLACSKVSVLEALLTFIIPL